MAVFSCEQIKALAPDAASFASACRVAKRTKTLISFGRSSRAVWGEYSCRYSRRSNSRVQIDLTTCECSCFCSDYKFPCKHILALMLLESEAKISESVEPDWVVNWLNEQAERKSLKAQKDAEREAKRNAKAQKIVDSTEVAKRKSASKRTADKRAKQVAEGFDELKIFLSDLIRGGVVNLERSWNTRKMFEERSKRLIDAKAPGVAALVEQCGDRLWDGEDWRERLLGRLGRLALLVEAYSKIDDAPEDLASEIRQTIGWKIPQKDVLASGERIEDRWFHLGATRIVGKRFQTTSSWMIGERTGRLAHALNFESERQISLDALNAPSVPLEGALRFYPGVVKLRALWEQASPPIPRPSHITPTPKFALTIPEFFANVAERLGRNPWLERFPALLRGVVVRPRVVQSWRRSFCEDYVLYDAQGNFMRIEAKDAVDKEVFWLFVAASADRAIEVFGEWDDNENKLKLLSGWDCGRALIVDGNPA